MRRAVTLRNEHGDEMLGVEHFPKFSDYPPSIDANGTHWEIAVWASRGWHVRDVGEWEE